MSPILTKSFVYQKGVAYLFDRRLVDGTGVRLRKKQSWIHEISSLSPDKLNFLNWVKFIDVDPLNWKLIVSVSSAKNVDSVFSINRRCGRNGLKK